MSEALDYAQALKPEICLPVHDGSLKNPATVHTASEKVLSAAGIKFIALELEKEMEV